MTETLDAVLARINQAAGIGALATMADDVDLAGLDIGRIRDALWQKYKDDIKKDQTRATEFNNRVIAYGGKRMRYTCAVKGNKPAKGHALYIALHGGGQTSPDENDDQWDQMATRYLDSIAEGYYVAPRGIEDVWNLHFLPQSYVMYDRMIENFLVFGDVDPDRVYLIGYSAGGDGVYQIACRMPDRWAAANMCAGHPNGVSGANLRNLPFQAQVGELDYAFDRNAEAVAFGQQLVGLAATYGGGYTHTVNINACARHSDIPDAKAAAGPHPVMADPTVWKNTAWRELDYRGRRWTLANSPHKVASDFAGTWRSQDGNQITITENGLRCAYDLQCGLKLDGAAMTRAEDGLSFDCGGMRGTISATGRATAQVETNAVRWTSQYQRSPAPARVVWDMKTGADRVDNRPNQFYWLEVPATARSKAAAAVDVTRQGNAITVSHAPAQMTLRLNGAMADLTKPLSVTVDGRAVQVRPRQSLRALARTLLDRGDRSFAFESRVVITSTGIYPPATTRVIGPVGNIGGGLIAFDDNASPVCGSAPITKVVVRHGDIVDAVQAFYGDSAEPGPKNGGDGGGASEFVLDPGDVITKVTGTTGNWYGTTYVLQLAFTTRNGKTSPTYGTGARAASSTPFELACQAGEQVLGFTGTTRLGATAGGGQSRYLTSLGVIVGKA